MPTSSSYTFFSTREEVIQILQAFAGALEVVVVGDTNKPELITSLDEIFGIERCQLFLRQPTRETRENTVDQAFTRARRTGFTVLHFPRVEAGRAIYGSLSCDDHYLEKGFPPAKPIYNVLRERLEVLTGGRRVVWKTSGRRSIYRYSPGIAQLVRDGVELYTRFDAFVLEEDLS